MNKQRRSVLNVDVRLGERLSISAGEDVSIELVHKSGNLARLRITAPKDVLIKKVAPSVPIMAT